MMNEPQSASLHAWEASLKPLIERVQGRIPVKDIPGVSFYESAEFQGHICDDIYGPMPYGVYAVPRGFVFGAFGVLFSHLGEVIREQNYGNLSEAELLAHVCAMPAKIQDPGSQNHVPHVVSLVSPCCYCFWHWMMDCLPKVILAESTGYHGSYLVPPPRMTPWVGTSMSLLGIDPSRLVEQQANITVTDVLYIPTYFSGFEARKNFSIIAKFRLLIRDALKAYPLNGSPEKILVARKPTVRVRKMLNLEQVAKLVSKYGFETVFFEDYPLLDQMRIALNARALVTPHGSGLTHSLFMPRHSSIVELFPFSRRESCQCYEYLMPVSGHRYFALDCEEDHGTDLMVSCDRLEAILQNALC